MVPKRFLLGSSRRVVDAVDTGGVAREVAMSWPDSFGLLCFLVFFYFLARLALGRR